MRVGVVQAQQRLTLLLLAISFVFACNVVHWSVAFPISYAPDERVRFYMIEHLERFGRLPFYPGGGQQAFVGPLSGLRYSTDEWWYYGLPNLDIWGSWLSARLLSPLFNAPDGYLGARAFNWMIAPIFSYTILLIAREAGGGRVAALLPALCVLAIPQITFVFAYVNSDALALTSCALLVYAVLVFARTRSRHAAACVGVAVGLLICTKLYYLTAIPAIILLVVTNTYASGTTITWRRVVLIIGSAACIAGPILIATYLEYGELFGLAGQADFVDRFRTDPTARFGLCMIFCQNDLINGPNLLWWVTLTFKSFFFAAGYMDVFLNSIVYAAFFVPLTVGALLLSGAYGALHLSAMMHRKREAAWEVGIAALPWGVLAVTIVLNILGQQSILPQPQGRYLFATIPFIVLALATMFATAPNVAKSPANIIRRTGTGFFALAFLISVAVNFGAYETLQQSLATILRPAAIAKTEHIHL